MDTVERVGTGSCTDHFLLKAPSGRALIGFRHNERATTSARPRYGSGMHRGPRGHSGARTTLYPRVGAGTRRSRCGTDCGRFRRTRPSRSVRDLGPGSRGWWRYPVEGRRRVGSRSARDHGRDCRRGPGGSAPRQRSSGRSERSAPAPRSSAGRLMGCVTWRSSKLGAVPWGGDRQSFRIPASIGVLGG